MLICGICLTWRPKRSEATAGPRAESGTGRSSGCCDYSYRSGTIRPATGRPEMSELLERIRSRGYWKAIVRPTTFVERRVKRHSDLLPILEKNSVEIKGWSFPHIDPVLAIDEGRTGSARSWRETIFSSFGVSTRAGSSFTTSLCQRIGAPAPIHGSSSLTEYLG